MTTDSDSGHVVGTAADCCCCCCRVFGPWLEGAVQQVEAGLNLTVVLTSDGQCFQMGETGASGRVKWEGCKEPELVRNVVGKAQTLQNANTF